MLDEKCELCRRLDKREDSHIIPKFVKRYIFNNIGKGKKFFFNRNPKKPAQDTLKLPFLCDSCEDMFQEFEKKYADEHFHPYNKDNRHNLIFNESIYRFLISLAWRVLRVTLINNEVRFLTINTCKAEISMRRYLLGKASSPGNIKLFLILDRDIIADPNAQKANGVHLDQSILFRAYKIPLMNFFPVAYKEGVLIKYGAFNLLCETFVFHDAENSIPKDDSYKGLWRGLEVGPESMQRDSSLPMPEDALEEILIDCSLLNEYLPYERSQ